MNLLRTTVGIVLVATLGLTSAGCDRLTGRDTNRPEVIPTDPRAVPFEATLDDKGRLASLLINAPAAGEDEAQTWEATYLNYGVPVQIDPPDGEVVDAPDETYRFFNG